jgi:hypothetical protein
MKKSLNIQGAAVGFIIDPPFVQGLFLVILTHKYTTKILTYPVTARIFLDQLQIFHQNPTNKNKTKYVIAPSKLQLKYHSPDI